MGKSKTAKTKVESHPPILFKYIVPHCMELMINEEPTKRQARQVETMLCEVKSELRTCFTILYLPWGIIASVWWAGLSSTKDGEINSIDCLCDKVLYYYMINHCIT